MRKRRKKIKLFGRMSIIYITMIIALSAMGVGYAAWTSGISMNVGITTGNIFPQVNPNSLKYGGLDYTLSEDNTTLFIKGEVYPGFNKDISVEVQDNGSIPTTLNNVDELSTSEIVNFGEQSKSSYNQYSLVAQDADVVETFNININASERDKNIMESSINSYALTDANIDHDAITDIQNEIDRTKEEINNIQMEIERLKGLKEKHNFKYNLNFKQGL